MIRIAFFLAIERDPLPFLHAAALVEQLVHVMPEAPIVQLTDAKTDPVPGVTDVWRIDARGGFLSQRLRHYAGLPAGDWILLDTDIRVRANVREVFHGAEWDVALCDRNWPHDPQGESMLQTMPFNAGVAFSRSNAFWYDVRVAWESLPEPDRESWKGEQLAIYEVVKSGRYRVKILPGQIYNYPPTSGSIPDDVALVHYKGPRKALLTPLAYATLAGTVETPACRPT